MIPAAGPLVGRFGPTRIGYLGFTLWISGLGGLLGAFYLTSLPFLIAAFLTANIGVFLLNAAINVEAGFVEVTLRKARMAWFHAAFSIGTVTGALLGVASLRAGISIYWHLLTLMLVAACFAVWVFRNFLPAQAVTAITSTSSSAPESASTARAKIPASEAWKEKRTLLIGVMVFGTGIMEGSASDWLALAMVDGFHLPSWYGTASLAVFLSALTATRLLSPRLQATFTPDRLLRRLLTLGLVGLALLAFSPYYWLALLGAALWGIGAALGYPLSASVLAVDPLRSAGRLSVMSTISFGSAIAGPALIGYLAEYVGYQQALGILLVPAFVAWLLTGQLRAEARA
ncbi:MAG: MFS transporter [Actinomycetaceae bacterium]|nr:MFS transporter [Actinomycetaceae bacterium]